MAKKVGIYYNEATLRSIMKGPEIEQMERDIMQSKLDEVKASFFQTFGFEGNFEIKAVMTRSARSRITYRIVAADKRTGAILKKNSGWLGKFV